MKLKKYNLKQTSDGIMNGYFIGTIFATSYKQIGHAHTFSLGDECIAVINFVTVEECEIDEA